MPQTFYRRRNKLKPEDWTEEIEKWEKYYMNDWYQIERRRKNYEEEIKEKAREERMICVRMFYEWIREEKEKRLLMTPDGKKFCGHYNKGEMEDGIIVCLKCGREIGRRQFQSVGYNNRHHTMRGTAKRQKK